MRLRMRIAKAGEHPMRIATECCQILGVLRGPKTQVSDRRYHGVHQLAIDA
jgi:hypothetical protein